MRTKRKRNERQKFKLARREPKEKLVTDLTLQDICAEQQGQAIAKHNKIVIHSSRLHKFYTCDGFKFNTGFKHRKIG